MAFDINLRRLRAQLHAMERSVRMMRVEVENALSAQGGSELFEGVEIATGLGRLLSGSEPVEHQGTQSYVPFVDGVWTSHDDEVPGTELTVRARVMHRLGPDDRSPGITRLTVHPVFSGQAEPVWCALETAIDPEAFRKAWAMQLDLVTHFEVQNRTKKPLAPNCKLILRIKNGKGEHRDVLERHFPTTTLPFDHTIVYTEAQLKAARPEDVTDATFILILPPAGDYAVHIDHFRLKALGG